MILLCPQGRFGFPDRLNRLFSGAGPSESRTATGN